MMTFPDDYLIPGIEPFHVEDAGIIYNADCRDILPRLPKVDLVFADPPYGVGINYGETYNDDNNNYSKFISQFFKCLDKSQLLMITPGIANVWLYPPAKWIMCWAKTNSMRRNGLGGFNQWEPILVYGKKVIYHDFLYVPIVPNKNGHPCPKPINLLKWIISKSSNDSDIILDPFLGSGTTAVAAKELGRKFIGIEISEEYCRIAVKRLRQQVFNFG